MDGNLLLSDGTTKTADAEEVRRALQEQQGMWLDLTSIDHDTTEILAEEFKIHPLSIEDLHHLGERPKLEAYENYVHLVVYGSGEKAADPIEVHALYCDQYLITFHSKEIPVLDSIRSRASALRAHGRGEGIFLLYRVIDALVDSFFPLLESFDDKIDDIEDEILERPTEAQLGILYDMKKQLVAVRKLVGPERDIFAGVSAGVLELPGMTDEAERYFRDIYDHLIRISDVVDSYRDLLSDAVDTHLSVVSNRLNIVMKQLTIIATIFLPLSFLTGFFGQNFGYLVSGITGSTVFWALGIGLEAITVVLLIVLFKKRQWI